MTASALLALHELAPGRIAFGIATGDSALWSIGEKPAEIAALGDYIRAIKRLLRGEAAEWRGHRFAPSWTAVEFPVEVPVLVARAGPKMLAMAAEEAEGFLVNMGYAPTMTASIVDTIERPATAAGRDTRKLKVWWNAPVVSAESRAAAMELQLGWGLNWLTEGTMEGKGISDHLKAAIFQFNVDNHDLYAVYKIPDRGRALVERAKKVGIYEWAIEKSPHLFGTVDEVFALLEVLAERGLANWMCFQPMHGTYSAQIENEKRDYIEKLAGIARRFA